MSAGRLIVLSTLLPFLALAQPPAPKPEPPREVAAAIKRGVAAMRKLQRSDGSWGPYGPGSTALGGMALLACGVKPDDPAIRAAASYVRYHTITSANTYSISLALVFLDHLGDKDDQAVIEVLSDRLIFAQKADGGWSYFSNPGKTGGLERTLPAPPPGNMNDPISERQDLKTHEVGWTDNSNTLFAILGLWAGHRWNIEVEPTLKKVEDRFRKTPRKMPIGVAWAYTYEDTTGMNGPRTSAALLGLAMTAGLRVERSMKSDKDANDGTSRPVEIEALLKDPLIRDGMKYVAAEYRNECLRINQPATIPDYYFLWSVERVAMAFALEKIVGVDWYTMGMRRILPAQMPTGVWTGTYGNEIDTSFALLFLSRSNFTKDLTDAFGGKAELKTDDPKSSSPELKSDSPMSESPKLAEKLVNDLLSAPSDQQAKRLEQYRDAKGIEYTEALAQVITKLTGETQKKARDCLAQRLARMTAATLRERLKDADTELRRAAAVACAIREDKSLIPDLIKVLDDSEPWVVRAAGVALSRLTGKDFGPPPEAPPDVQAKAVAAWKNWWKSQAKGK